MNKCSPIEIRENLRSNGLVSILKEPFSKDQHPNQQEGLNVYVVIIPHDTGVINTVKLYENKKGLHIKTRHGTFYIDDFTEKYNYVPFQMIKAGGDE